jgi:hypothetical protein
MNKILIFFFLSFSLFAQKNNDSQVLYSLKGNFSPINLGVSAEVNYYFKEDRSIGVEVHANRFESSINVPDNKTLMDLNFDFLEDLNEPYIGALLKYESIHFISEKNFQMALSAGIGLSSYRKVIDYTEKSAPFSTIYNEVYKSYFLPEAMMGIHFTKAKGTSNFYTGIDVFSNLKKTGVMLKVGFIIRKREKGYKDFPKS